MYQRLYCLLSLAIRNSASELMLLLYIHIKKYWDRMFLQDEQYLSTTGCEELYTSTSSQGQT